MYSITACHFHCVNHVLLCLLRPPSPTSFNQMYRQVTRTLVKQLSVLTLRLSCHVLLPSFPLFTTDIFYFLVYSYLYQDIQQLTCLISLCFLSCFCWLQLAMQELSDHLITNNYRNVHGISFGQSDSLISIQSRHVYDILTCIHKIYNTCSICCCRNTYLL